MWMDPSTIFSFIDFLPAFCFDVLLLLFVFLFICVKLLLMFRINAVPGYAMKTRRKVKMRMNGIESLSQNSLPSWPYITLYSSTQTVLSYALV